MLWCPSNCVLTITSRPLDLTSIQRYEITAILFTSCYYTTKCTCLDPWVLLHIKTNYILILLPLGIFRKYTVRAVTSKAWRHSMLEWILGSPITDGYLPSSVKEIKSVLRLMLTTSPYLSAGCENNVVWPTSVVPNHVSREIAIIVLQMV